jgi:hypothetical protein
MPRFQRLLEAEHIFSISETTRQDLLKTFGLPSLKVTNINGGFTKSAESAQKPTNFIVPSKFILFPTGDLPHKNNEIAVKGFEKYYANSDKTTPLLITSKFQEKSKEELLSFSKNIIFTENVSDEELEWLYENAQAVLFASKYEGLGMPVLDAASSHKPIITSRIPVFEEMSRGAFYYFGPTDSDELATAVLKALTHEKFSVKLSQYPAIMAKYTWLKTCKAIINYTQSLSADGPVISKSQGQTLKPRIAVVCLHPGISGQIGRAAESTHFSFSEKFEVDYYLDANGYHYREMERPTFLDFLDCTVLDICKLTLQTYKKYDRIIYFIDKAVLPSRVAQRACVLPGLVLFDFTGAKLDKQQEMLKKLILDNQYAAYSLNRHSYLAYQELMCTLDKEIVKTRKNPNSAENIIRKGGFNSSTIRRLIAIR